MAWLFTSSSFDLFEVSGRIGSIAARDQWGIADLLCLGKSIKTFTGSWRSPKDEAANWEEKQGDCRGTLPTVKRQSANVCKSEPYWAIWLLSILFKFSSGMLPHVVWQSWHSCLPAASKKFCPLEAEPAASGLRRTQHVSSNFSLRNEPKGLVSPDFGMTFEWFGFVFDISWIID